MMKKFIAVLTAATLLFATLPLTALAAEDETQMGESILEEEQEQETVSSEPLDLSLETTQEEIFAPDDQNGTEDETTEEPGSDETSSSPETETGEESGEPEETPDSPDAQPDQPFFGMYLDEHVAYVSGDGDMVFPENKLSRSEAASLIYQLLTDPAQPSESHFSDVPEGAWYQTFVDSLAEMKILSGMGNGTFQPKNNITRAEFAAMLSKLFPMETAEVNFSDVSETHWAYAAIQNAVAKNWVSGYPDGTFRPDSSITRAEAFAMMNKMLGRSPDKELIDAQGKILRFLDLPYNYWAYYHIMEASIPHDHSYDENGNEVWEYYQVPTAQLGQGPHLVEGELYCVGSDGYYVRNDSVGVLKFDDSGRYTTGDTALDKKLTSIVLQEANSSDSLYNNLRRMYDYVIDDYSYLAVTHVPQGSTGWENSYASSMIDRHMGNCYSYAALFTLLARKMGYQAQAVSGLVTVDSCLTWTYGYWSEHGWVEIKMDDGKIYVCDPQLRAGHANTWGYNWDLFMKPYGQSVAHYKVNDNVLS